MLTAFHSLRFGKGNSTADWVASGDSKSLPCGPWEAASSPRPDGCVPYDGIVSGLPRLTFFLIASGRRFHYWRATSLKEVALLAFDGLFDLSNLSSTRLSPLSAFHVAALIEYLSSLATGTGCPKIGLQCGGRRSACHRQDRSATSLQSVTNFSKHCLERRSDRSTDEGSQSHFGSRHARARLL